MSGEVFLVHSVPLCPSVYEGKVSKNMLMHGLINLFLCSDVSHSVTHEVPVLSMQHFVLMNMFLLLIICRECKMT